MVGYKDRAKERQNNKGQWQRNECRMNINKSWRNKRVEWE